MRVLYGVSLTLIALFFLVATWWSGYLSGVREAEARLLSDDRERAPR